MKLYIKALCISIKYTFKAAALPFVALLLCVAFIGVAIPTGTKAQKLAVGIRCLDTHPLVPILIETMLSSPQVEEFAELHMLSPDEEVGGLAAVITLPQGLTDSILQGENLSPTVQLGSDSSISNVYVRELCTAIERYLSSAQAGIYTAQKVVKGLPSEQYDRVITDINISYATLFLNRQAMLSKDFRSFDSNYLLRCAVAVLLFLLCGALGGAVPSMLSVAGTMAGIKHSGWSLFSGAVSGVLLFCLPITLFCLTLAFGVQVCQQPLTVLLLAVLLGAVSIFFFVAIGNSGTSAMVLCGFTLITAFMSGLIIPADILPQAMTGLAPLLPIYHVWELVSLLSGGYATINLGAVCVQIALWLSASGLLWVVEVRRR